MDADMLDKKLRSAGRRHSGSIFLSRLAAALVAAGGVAAVAALAHRLLGLPAFTMETVGSALLAAVLVGGVWWFFGRPSRAAVAVLVDERLGLKERVSTALAFSDSGDAFAQAAAGQARAAADRLNVPPHFPVRPGGRRWVLAILTWGLAAALFVLVPTWDALGFLKKQTDEEKAKTEAVQAQADVKEAVKQLEAVVKQLGDPTLLNQLEQLKEIPPTASADEIRRQAIQKLEDISQKTRDLQNQQNLAQAQALQDKLQQLRSPPNSESQELNRALQKGDFAKASQTLSELRQKLDEGKMTPEQKEALAKQLEELARQLEKLAQDNADLAEELAKKGMDKELASTTPEELREALKKAGLSDEDIEKLMQKAQQNQAANKACKGLGKSMGLPGLSSPAGLGSGDLADFQDMLNDLEVAQMRLDQVQKASELAKDAQTRLGCSQCKGAGCESCQGGGSGEDGNGIGSGKNGSGTSPWGPGGLTDGIGQGTGGAGRGFGERPTADDDGTTKTNKTRANNPDAPDAPIIASWHIQGDQIKGEATQSVGDVVQTKREQAAQAVTDNDIPKKYDGAIQKYYNEFAK